MTPQEFEQWDDAYAAAMRRVYADFPDDHDVMALLVEALMMRTVRRSVGPEDGRAGAEFGRRRGAGRFASGRSRLADEAGVAQHPAILHLHIHLLEMSTMPERAHALGGPARRDVPRCRPHEPYARPHLRAVRRIREGQACQRKGGSRQRSLSRLCGRTHLLSARLLPRPASDDVHLHVPRPVRARAVGRRQGAQPGDA